MQLVVYILVYPLLWLISRLPFKIIYFISDGVYVLLYHVIGYRKKVVRNNLVLAFPEKSDEERLLIEKEFYKHFCDMFLEMIKTLGITNKQMKKRYVFTNVEVMQKLENEGKNIMIMMPHYASWEWVFSLNSMVKSKAYAIYQPIQNKYFDRLVRNIRSKYGTTLIKTYESRNIIAAAKETNELITVGIISDQSPMLQRARHWTKFMDVLVPIHVGAEELCKSHGMIPVYLKVKKVGRGYYQATFKILTENPSVIANYEISEAFMKETEKSIREAPEYYFWTHKRWKHKDKVPKEFQKDTSKAVSS
ncbi:lysophospholipid acyltransferase family protein [Flagellimonas halotolerans]|uniref:Lysophospholipid acyltransferase family protein n=1 Tax=Flagellimonas halotolerans TaxID=3112164 RepID=A0ABU6IMZ4_9FLAO|nr:MULTISPECIES: lysophospholipid acyltransferase family protein [unclassified Allomuricauda]MEC3964572.1 lysophospholipid acyltransferase family protein [Muricauda sp. SYSU M86414]MEC4264441.1 lysophospholipid acyltransferase family protein [Muricauda sp. SYSU M84420]